MSRRIPSLVWTLLCVLLAQGPGISRAAPPPARPAVRAFHALMPGYWGSDGRQHIPACEKFIREGLAPSGINVLVLEVGYNFQYQSVPRIGSRNAVGPEDVKRLLKACRESGIKLIPQLNCLGHQATGKGSLLGEYPEFREKPGEYPKFLKDPMPKQTQGTSYCSLHPEVHRAVFALLDELADVFETDAIHVGMDEVFAIASSNCPRCAEKDPADLFAGEVKALHDHLASKQRTMWMWGDRFILASEHGFVDWGWASSRNGMYGAIDRVPKDIVICDWHYDVAPPTPRHFVNKGFPTVAAIWWNEGVALRYLAMMRELSAAADPQVASRSRGLMQTTWVEMQDFITAWNGRIPPLDQQPEWQRKSDFPWKAAKGSAAVLRRLAASWDISDEQLRQAIGETDKVQHAAPPAKLLVWAGEATDAGVGWAGPADSPAAIELQKGRGREGKAAVEFRSDGQGWRGCLWNWHGWWPEGAGTDIGPRTHLCFWIKADGQQPDSLDVGLGCASGKKTGAVSIAQYAPGVWDGKWHQAVIPLKDIYAKEKTEFDRSRARELDLGTWSQTPRKFNILIGEIGFETR